MERRGLKRWWAQAILVESTIALETVDLCLLSTGSLVILYLVGLRNPSNETSWPALHCQGRRIHSHSNVRNSFCITRYRWISFKIMLAPLDIRNMSTLFPYPWLLCLTLFGQVIWPDYRRKYNDFTSCFSWNNAWNERIPMFLFLGPCSWAMPFRLPLGIYDTAIP